MKYSIITPVHLYGPDRAEKFKACLESVANQDFDHSQFEHVIVNDGSTFPFVFPDYPWLKVINQPNLNRLTAYNTGFRNASGEVFVLLDSDDELFSNAIALIDRSFSENPEYKMLNFGCEYLYNDGKVTRRDPFKPAVVNMGHEVFGGGNIVNGTFVYKRELYDTLGGFPEGSKTIDVEWYKKEELMWTSPYDFAAYAYVEFPEIKHLFTVTHPDHPKGLIKELGNPWGQDFYLFYKYTRKFHSKPIDEFILKVHVR